MNNRKFNIGEKVYCTESGVIGIAIKFYTPTSCAEQTMVKTDDGRKYHTPTSCWEAYKYGLIPSMTIMDECFFGINRTSVANIALNINSYIKDDEQHIKSRYIYKVNTK